MIAIVDYGMGNLRSVQKACEYTGHSACVTQDAQTIRDASHIILPGVGSFIAGMNGLGDMRQLITAQAQSGKPLLGICLGMQMLFEHSFEGGKTDGLGLLEGDIVPFPTGKEKVPHVGWNSLKMKENPLFRGIEQDAYVYFVHSYHADNGVNTAATCRYIVDFAAAAARENIFGVQFHPEKSGNVGLRMLENFGNIR